MIFASWGTEQNPQVEVPVVFWGYSHSCASLLQYWFSPEIDAFFGYKSVSQVKSSQVKFSGQKANSTSYKINYNNDV